MYTSPPVAYWQIWHSHNWCAADSLHCWVRSSTHFRGSYCHPSSESRSPRRVVTRDRQGVIVVLSS